MAHFVLCANNKHERNLVFAQILMHVCFRSDSQTNKSSIYSVNENIFIQG